MDRSLKMALVAAILISILVASCQLSSPKRQFNLKDLSIGKTDLLETASASGSVSQEKRELAGLTKDFLQQTYLNLDHSKGNAASYISSDYVEQFDNDWKIIDGITKKASSIDSAKAKITKLALNYSKSAKPVLASAEFQLEVFYTEKSGKKMKLKAGGSLVMAKDDDVWKVIDYKINNRIW